MSRFAFRNRPRKLSKAMGHNSGPPGRELRLQKTISMLLRFQRIEGSWGVINETREYTEAVSSNFLENRVKSVLIFISMYIVAQYLLTNMISLNELIWSI